MIARIWRGWTAAENADRYEEILLHTVIPGIVAKQVAGFRDIRVLRRDAEGEVEFQTIMTFDSLEAVRAFAGDEYEVAYVPAVARAVLARFDVTSAHFEVRHPA